MSCMRCRVEVGCMRWSEWRWVWFCIWSRSGWGISMARESENTGWGSESASQRVCELRESVWGRDKSRRGASRRLRLWSIQKLWAVQWTKDICSFATLRLDEYRGGYGLMDEGKYTHTDTGKLFRCLLCQMPQRVIDNELVSKQLVASWLIS